MPVMHYDGRIPSVSIRWQWFFWDYISVHNSNLCNHCYSYNGYIYFYTCMHKQSLLAVPTAWRSGSVLGEVVVLLSLRQSVGEEGLIWIEFCTSPSPFPNNRRLRQGQLHHYSYDFSYVSWKGQLDSHVTVRSMSEICASQEFLEYRYPVSIPSHYSFQESKPPRI